jgi:hypothetical protein
MMYRTLHAGLSALTLVGLLTIGAAPAFSQACTVDQVSAVVDQAGAQLRAITQANQAKIEQRLKALQAKRGWSGTDGDDKSYAELADPRMAALDQTANELLARIDQLGNVPTNSVAECGRVQELEAASLELQATVKAKSAYMLQRLDQLIAGGTQQSAETATVNSQTAPAVATAPALPATQPATPSAPASAPAPLAPPLATVPAPPKLPQVTAAPLKAPAPPNVATPWSTTTNVDAPAAVQPPPSSQPPVAAGQVEEDGYAIEEIVRASTGLFGKVSAGLGSVVEHAFSNSGRPAGYIIGTESGGAFIAGLRYGSGTLYLRSGGTMPIHWHGPSLGADIGAQGAKIMFLVYRLRDPDQLWSSFSSVEGSAFLAGGIGFNLMTNGAVQMAPIRSGVGLRLGASVGYIRFTRRPTWNPF